MRERIGEGLWVWFGWSFVEKFCVYVISNCCLSIRMPWGVGGGKRFSLHNLSHRGMGLA